MRLSVRNDLVLDSLSITGFKYITAKLYHVQLEPGFRYVRLFCLYSFIYFATFCSFESKKEFWMILTVILSKKIKRYLYGYDIINTEAIII